MKALRYLLIVIGMVSVLGVYAQGLATKPEAQMQSTSVMVGTGSTLPSAATRGTYVTGSTIGTYTSTKDHPGQIRKVGGNTTGGSGDREDPFEDPLGDVLWPLMLVACMYALMRAIFIRKRAGEVRK